METADGCCLVQRKIAKPSKCFGQSSSPHDFPQPDFLGAWNFYSSKIAVVVLTF
jgi:hypothetical protein